MAKFNQKEIAAFALKTISEKPGGIRYSDLVRVISSASPETPLNTIHGTVWNLHRKYPQKVTKPGRGLFAPAGSAEADGHTPTETVVEDTVKQGSRVYKESDFYESFADWLKNDLDEVIDSVALGGAAMGKKWGTPDVVGVYKPLASDLVKFPLEVVSAEIKIDPQQPVVAFGQAIAYRLFSAKTYIAMPTTMSDDDLARLEALCMLFGVGLALFTLNPADPKFDIRVRAQRFSPDMFFVNEFAERLKDADADLFEKLFR